MLRRSTLVKPRTFQSAGAAIRTLVEFDSVEPDYLRDQVCRALSSISESERSDYRSKLLAELRKAGLRLRQTLLMLGVSARTADDLTAPEIAALIRYVRLTEPKTLSAVAEPLTELLSIVDSRTRVSGKAA